MVVKGMQMSVVIKLWQGLYESCSYLAYHTPPGTVYCSVASTPPIVISHSWILRQQNQTIICVKDSLQRHSIIIS